MVRIKRRSRTATAKRLVRVAGDVERAGKLIYWICVVSMCEICEMWKELNWNTEPRKLRMKPDAIKNHKGELAVPIFQLYSGLFVKYSSRPTNQLDRIQWTRQTRSDNSSYWTVKRNPPHSDPHHSILISGHRIATDKSPQHLNGLDHP